MKYPLIKPAYYIGLFKELTGFIKHPSLVEDTSKSTRLKIYDTFGLFVLKLIFLIPVFLFFGLVYNPEDVQGVAMSQRFSPLMLLLVGGFILPLVEETAFRLSLRFKPTYLALSLAVITYYVLTKVVFATKISAVDSTFTLRVFISLMTGFVLWLFFKEEVISSRLNAFWNRNFRYIFYTTSVIFAWMHFSKYEFNWTTLLLLPILTLPQLYSALIYGYLRVSYGFRYPLLFHMTNNFVAIGISLLPFADLIL